MSTCYFCWSGLYRSYVLRHIRLRSFAVLCVVNTYTIKWSLIWFYIVCTILVLNKVADGISYGEAPPRGPTPYPFIYHFWQKTYPFRLPSFDKWCPFHRHIFPSLEVCIPFNYCKCTFCKIWMNLKPECFLDFFTAIKCVCHSILLGLFPDQDDRISCSFIHFNWRNPYRFIYLSWSLKKVPLSDGAYPYRPL